MKTKTLYITDSGVELTNIDDGFIVHGAITRGDNGFAIVGDARLAEGYLAENDVPPIALTVFELLDLLDLRPEVLIDYYDNHMKRERGQSRSRDRLTSQVSTVGMKEPVH